MEIADLYVTLTSQVGGFMAGMSLVENSLKALESTRMAALAGLAGFGFAVGGIALGIGIAATNMASKFQASMELLHTEAQVPQAQINALGDQVLSLAGKVGTNPDSLAAALYHIESTFQSTGITGQQAMNILKVAAEGARIGQANLVDVTNALDSTIVAGIPGAQNYSQTMGSLLAIIGSGDMTMQNLADAMSTGIVPVAKEAGLSLTDLGAALATLGDNNIRGATAANRLRTTLLMMESPSTTAAKALAKVGLGSNDLAMDMRKPNGLIVALQDFQTHLRNSGLTATEQAQVIADAFGKSRSSATIELLMTQLDRLQSKYGDITHGATNFGDAWKQTQATLQQKMAEWRATLDALLIRLGQVLIPYVIKFGSAVAAATQWLIAHKTILEIVAGVIGGVLVAALGAAALALGALVVDALPMIGLALAIGAAIAGLAYAGDYIYSHWNTIWPAMKNIINDALGHIGLNIGDLVKGFNAVKDVVVRVVDDVVSAIVHWRDTLNTLKDGVSDVLHAFGSSFGNIRSMVLTVWNTLWGTVKNVFEQAVHLIQQLLGFMEGWFKEHWDSIKDIVMVAVAIVYEIIAAAVRVIQETWKTAWDIIRRTVEVVWEVISTEIKTAIHIIMDVIGVVLDLLTGKWGKAWHDLEDIFGTIWNDIVKILTSIVPQVLSIILDLFKLLGLAVYGILKPVLDAIGRFFRDAWNDVYNFLASVPGTVAHFFAQIGQAVWDALNTTFQAVWAFFEAIPSEILSFLESLPNDLYWAAVYAIGGFILGIIYAANGIWDFFQALPGAILAFFSTVGTWLYKVGTDLVTGFYNAIVSAANTLWNFWRNLPLVIWGLLSSAGTWLLNTGSSIISGMLNGIGSAAVAVWNWFRGLPGVIGGFFTGAINWVVGAGEQIINGVKNGIVAAWNGIVAWFRGLPGVIGNFFSGCVNWLVGAGEQLINGLVKGMQNALGGLGGFLGSIVGFVQQHKGPPAYDAVALMGNGQLLMEGLVKGMDSHMPMLQSQINKINSTISGTGSVGFAAGSGGAATRLGGGASVVLSPNYEFHIDGGSSEGLPQETMDQLHQLMEENNQQLVALLEQHLQ